MCANAILHNPSSTESVANVYAASATERKRSSAKSTLLKVQINTILISEDDEHVEKSWGVHSPQAKDPGTWERKSREAPGWVLVSFRWIKWLIWTLVRIVLPSLGARPVSILLEPIRGHLEVTWLWSTCFCVYCPVSRGWTGWGR